MQCRCGESQCPEFCLCTEVFPCFGNSVASTRFLLQDQFNLQTTKWRCVNAAKVTSTAGSTNTYMQDLENKIRQSVVEEVVAKVNKKVEERVDAQVEKKVQKVLKRLGEANPGITIDIQSLCAIQPDNDNGMPMTCDNSL